MEVMFVVGGIFGIAILAAIIAAIATVVSVPGALSKEDEDEA